MSTKKTKQPGTVNPEKRVVRAIEDRLGYIGKNDEVIPNKKSTSLKKDGKPVSKKRSRTPKKDPGKIRAKHRRPGSKKSFEEGTDMSDVIDAVKYLIENHGRNVRSILRGFQDKKLLSRIATKCMSTCLTGWKTSGADLISDNTNMVLSGQSWKVLEDGRAGLKNGFEFDYDWLYDVANGNVITEDIDETEVDVDTFSDTLSNASNLLRKLSDKEIKKYILNAAKNEEDVDMANLKEVLEELVAGKDVSIPQTGALGCSIKWVN